MPMIESAVIANAKNKLKAKGFVLDNEHSKQAEFIEAIVEAVIEEIRTNASTVVLSGSSSGLHKII